MFNPVVRKILSYVRLFQIAPIYSTLIFHSDKNIQHPHALLCFKQNSTISLLINNREDAKLRHYVGNQQRVRTYYHCSW